MIPVNIDDPIVLRRTLEELEALSISIDVQITEVESIKVGSTLADVVTQLNIISTRLNIVISAVNSSLR